MKVRLLSPLNLRAASFKVVLICLLRISIL